MELGNADRPTSLFMAMLLCVCAVMWRRLRWNNNTETGSSRSSNSNNTATITTTLTTTATATTTTTSQPTKTRAAAAATTATTQQTPTTTHTYTNTLECTSQEICVRVSSRRQAERRPHTHTHTHTYTYIHTHTHTPITHPSHHSGALDAEQERLTYVLYHKMVEQGVSLIPGVGFRLFSGAVALLLLLFPCFPLDALLRAVLIPGAGMSLFLLFSGAVVFLHPSFLVSPFMLCFVLYSFLCRSSFFPGAVVFSTSSLRFPFHVLFHLPGSCFASCSMWFIPASRVCGAVVSLLLFFFPFPQNHGSGKKKEEHIRFIFASCCMRLITGHLS
jgi:hypothetical protein